MRGGAGRIDAAQLGGFEQPIYKKWGGRERRRENWSSVRRGKVGVTSVHMHARALTPVELDKHLSVMNCFFFFFSATFQVLILTLSNTHINRLTNPVFCAAIQHCLLISWPGSE